MSEATVRWRRQAPWLLGALILAAWCIGWAYLKDRKDYRLWHPSVPRAIAPGAWGHYEGARWRIVEARVLPPAALQALQVRPDSQVVLATLDVVLDNGTPAARVESCRTALRDPQGRKWNAQPQTLSRYRFKPYGSSCGSRLGENFQREQARPGRPFRFQQIYQLPRDVPLRGLRLELHLPGLKQEERGRYVEFTL